MSFLGARAGEDPAQAEVALVAADLVHFTSAFRIGFSIVQGRENVAGSMFIPGRDIVSDQEETPVMEPTPARWLTEHAHLLPVTGSALDVASGRGRHALWLAARGLAVQAIDRNATAIGELDAAARHRRLGIHARVLDLESATPDIPTGAFDVIVVINYLHRPLFPTLVAGLRPGGLLIYETFTRAQAARGRPTNPAFLLEPGELGRLVGALEVIARREGTFEERDVASVVARAPASPYL